MTSESRTQIDPTGFQRYDTRDRFGRLISFYVSNVGGSSAPAPLILFIQGSGCQSVFRTGQDGRVRGGHQNLLSQVARGRACVLVVEKPGVNYLDNPSCNGTAEGCSKTFLEEHTLPRWVEALRSALIAAQALQNVDRRKLLVVGHSEGGIVAARLAAENPEISHVAILSGSGPTQLFDLAEHARASVNPDEPAEVREKRVRELYEIYSQIQAEPESTTRFAWGHPFRRWSSFLATSTLDELLHSNARFYIAHGSNDAVVPIAAFEVLRAELIRHGCDVTAERVEGADHGFRLAGQEPAESMINVLEHVVAWFVGEAL